MTFLFPLYLAGLAAISAPIILHMIRRQTQKRTLFSSLMFLAASPPRMQKRKRVENWLLLLLRCAALILLALAFARPFWADPLPAADVGRRVVLLLDTSGSMQRAGLWNEAVEKTLSTMEDMDAGDRMAIYTFDARPSTLITFDQWANLGPERAKSLVTQRLQDMQPGWGATDLGTAMLMAGRACEDDESDGYQAGTQSVIIVSDMQQGADLTAMRNFEWPKQLVCHLMPVRPDHSTNASISLIVDTDTDSAPKMLGPKIRITNSEGSDPAHSHFQLTWEGSDRPALSVHVPPGHQQTLRISPPPTARSILKLSGDDHPFDNQLFVTAQLPRPLNILYLGNDDGGRDGMLFFLRRVFMPSTSFLPRITARSPDHLENIDESAVDLIVAQGPLGLKAVSLLRRHVEKGRPGLLVIGESKDRTLTQLLGLNDLAPKSIDPADGYAILGRLDLGHPLLQPLAEARFSDFSKIHFWKYRQLNTKSIPNANILAWFDSGDPAWVDVPIGRGSLLVMTSGWKPADSQLARSSKFIPLLYGVAERNVNFKPRQTQFLVGDPPPRSADKGPRNIEGPDGKTMTLDPGQPAAPLGHPGFYTLNKADTFAVNLRGNESLTAPLSDDDFERAGVPIEEETHARTAQDQTAQHTAAHNTKQERDQSWWRLLIMAALVALTIETCLAAFYRPRNTESETPS
jgi:hypothetical protein